MEALEVRLFGRFSVRWGGRTTNVVEPSKAQELFSYLLLHRGQSHARELLSTRLWSERSDAQSRKYLRQTLWQLHAALDPLCQPAGERLVLVESDWVRINTRVNIWLDVAVFEQACRLAQGMSGHELDDEQVQILQGAVDLYRGDLLEDWYHDWCLYERERLQNLYLGLLDKLMEHCEAHGTYEMGLDYGERCLRLDRAHERTHRSMMRLHYLSGDRTAALRQYGRCLTALNEELGVQPAQDTEALYDRIRLGELDEQPLPLEESAPPPSEALRTALDRIGTLQEILTSVQQQVAQLQHDLRVAEDDRYWKGRSAPWSSMYQTAAPPSTRQREAFSAAAARSLKT